MKKGRKDLDTWQNLSSISVSLTYESNFSIEDITIGCSVFFNSYSLLLLLKPSLYNLYSIRSQDLVVVQTDNFTISVFTRRMKLAPGNQRVCSPLFKWKPLQLSFPKRKLETNPHTNSLANFLKYIKYPTFWRERVACYIGRMVVGFEKCWGYVPWILYLIASYQEY